MKIRIEQLDTRTRNTIALALEHYASFVEQIDSACCDKYQMIATQMRTSEVLVCTYEYPGAVDDVQVLGKNEKGGEV